MTQLPHPLRIAVVYFLARGRATQKNTKAKKALAQIREWHTHSHQMESFWLVMTSRARSLCMYPVRILGLHSFPLSSTFLLLPHSMGGESLYAQSTLPVSKSPFIHLTYTLKLREIAANAKGFLFLVSTTSTWTSSAVHLVCHNSLYKSHTPLTTIKWSVDT